MKTTAYKVPSFSVMHDNKKIETLEHCFIEHMLLDSSNPPASIKAKNGASYIAVYDNLILPLEGESQNIKVIVSFQKHSYGMFAIVRNYKTDFRKAKEL